MTERAVKCAPTRIRGGARTIRGWWRRHRATGPGGFLRRVREAGLSVAEPWPLGAPERAGLGGSAWAVVDRIRQLAPGGTRQVASRWDASARPSTECVSAPTTRRVSASSSAMRESFGRRIRA